MNRRHIRRAMGVLAGVLLMAGGAIVGGGVATRGVKAELASRTRAAAELRASMLRSELEKYQSLPFVLAQDPDVKAALESGGGQIALQMNSKLEGLARQTRAAAIYLIDRSGRTVAASNWRLPISFVGVNYSFRPYFRDAMANGAAELFALGTVSLHPGLYLARRVEGAAAPLGVIVVKVQFDSLEAQWRASDERAFITDRGGTVLITSVPARRFKHVQVPANTDEAIRAGLPGQTRYVAVRTATAKAGWTLHLLAPLDPAVRTARTAGQMIGAVGVGLLVLGIAVALSRRARAREQSRRQEAAQRELEARVVERTQDLQAANERLVFEMDERRRAEASLHTLQDELVQANKLAVLGQITAGVAHEINQPLAAIRSYVDNSELLLGRGDVATVQANLGEVASLTDRIGLITRELRAFARKTAGVSGPLCVESAVGGALLLVGARLRHRGIRLVREGTGDDIHVVAERIRLEQVLVNLLQNAIDALQDVPDAMVRLRVVGRAQQVEITVADNGPGLAPQVAESLFTPFLTTKPQGLGLGLVISRDILAEVDGALEHVAMSGRGAAFAITLRRSP